MKKALSVILAVLLVFSAVSVMAFAEEDTKDFVKVSFYIDAEDFEKEGGEYYWLYVLPGSNFVKRLQEGDNVLVIPTKESTETTKYTFKYWEQYKQNSTGKWIATDTIYYTGTIPDAPELDSFKEGMDAEVRYVAVFEEEEIKEPQTFWALVASIFARINAIFEYLAEVFKDTVIFG